MKRTVLLLFPLFGILFGLWVYQHAQTPRDASQQGTLLQWVDQQTRPILYANVPVSSDSISTAEAYRQIERLYRLQADIMAADATGDVLRANQLLDTAVRRLHDLTQRPGMAEQTRFRNVFRTLTSEYQERYGVPDTLSLPRGDIYDFRTSLFASLNSDTPPMLEDVIPSDIRMTDTEVPMTINERVEESIAFLLKNRRLHLYPWLRRSSTYFPMIEHIFAEENVPDELKYLALVESGLNPYAQSHARASGIWQFVAPTGRQYGLTVDPWVDERLDPEKSTRAAARHLRDLHELFGDWHLALAGYNCSPSVIRRAIRKARRHLDREPTFWDIYPDLPQETRNYVPLYIAASVLISNPAAFHLDRVAPGPRYAFDHVPVESTLSLEQVAGLAGVDVAKVRALNPELRADRLPPSKEPYYVRLPYGTYQEFATNYQALPPEERPTLIQHAVQPGETVGKVAERYHVARPSLVQANPDRPLTVGQTLIVPAAKYDGNHEIVATADAKPIRVRYGNRATRPIAEVGAPPLPEASSSITASL